MTKPQLLQAIQNLGIATDIYNFDLGVGSPYGSFLLSDPTPKLFLKGNNP